MGVVTVTMSPTTCVKPLPGPRRSLTGANIVPRNSIRPSGYWWLATDRVAHEVERIAADHRHRTDARHLEAIRAVDAHGDVAAADVVDAEAFVEEANERTDRARRVVVLGLAEKQRAAALEIAQVDVVAERRAHGAAVAVHREHDFRLRIVPLRLGVDAHLGAQTHRRHRLRLGEDLGIGTDAHLEVLRPGALPDQRFLHLRRLGRAGTDFRQVVADHRDDFAAHGNGLGRDRRAPVPR